MRQCTGCGIVLAPGRRSPHCERCRVDYQRQRNREKVWAFRVRAAAAPLASSGAPASRPPNEQELAWLRSLDFGLEEPIRRVHELMALGRTVSDPEVVRLASLALEQYRRPACRVRGRGYGRI